MSENFRCSFSHDSRSCSSSARLRSRDRFACTCAAFSGHRLTAPLGRSHDRLIGNTSLCYLATLSFSPEGTDTGSPLDGPDHYKFRPDQLQCNSHCITISLLLTLCAVSPEPCPQDPLPSTQTQGYGEVSVANVHIVAEGVHLTMHSWRQSLALQGRPASAHSCGCGMQGND